MIGMEPHRDMTVGELRAVLATLPDYWHVIPVVNGVKGVLMGVREECTTESDGVSVLIGEVDLPARLQERLIHGEPA